MSPSSVAMVAVVPSPAGSDMATAIGVASGGPRVGVGSGVGLEVGTTGGLCSGPPAVIWEHTTQPPFSLTTSTSSEMSRDCPRAAIIRLTWSSVAWLPRSCLTGSFALAASTAVTSLPVTCTTAESPLMLACLASRFWKSNVMASRSAAGMLEEVPVMPPTIASRCAAQTSGGSLSKALALIVFTNPVTAPTGSPAGPLAGGPGVGVGPGVGEGHTVAAVRAAA